MDAYQLTWTELITLENASAGAQYRMIFNSERAAERVAKIARTRAMAGTVKIQRIDPPIGNWLKMKPSESTT